ncbi:hypothetical protein C8J57DRAFT_1587994 [Mycena rebaudengoi]|nr:hypothetical protein C8J57DRAFT_1587994 [Mycena rebaudengoi]
MPVSFTVAQHSTSPVPGNPNGQSPKQILVAACPTSGAGNILGTSFSEKFEDKPLVNEIKPSSSTTSPPRQTGSSTPSSRPTTNTNALILRPDDVWIAILTQFNFYINANAEILRANFIAHEGKKKLELSTAVGQDFEMLAPLMVDLIRRNIVDPSLCAWALPDFTTTTLNDTIVSSIVLMASLKSYFEYSYNPCTCGIPRVTLEGERRDWEKILERLEKLKEYGIETIAWYHLLVPVISRFVKAFDDPSGLSNIKFWENVVRIDSGSGSDTYDGWITAFCVFDYRGRWLGTPLKLGVVLDHTHFHSIDSDKVPPSHAEVDVTVVSDFEATACKMVAGLVGTRATGTAVKDTVRPVIGWWMFVKE